jgi:hypothetical protein
MSTRSRDRLASDALAALGGSIMSDPYIGSLMNSIASEPNIKREVIIKDEALNDASSKADFAKMEEADVGDPDYGEAEGILSDDEGTTYYLDGEFKIKQVPPAGVVRRTIGDFASKYRR